jgi:glycosyltransferase involved in cell wall biosynthesis
MRKVVFIGSHLGYPMDKTPLGGGAMVGLELLRHWPVLPGVEIVALGSGPQTPRAEFRYVQAAAQERALESLSELDYADFCRKFEAETTAWLMSRQAEFPPKQTVVIVNDISEGPTLKTLTQAGYPVVSLWHVDVVDYFNKLYLKQLIPVHALAKVYEAARKVRGLLPDLLSLVFEKQRETVLHSSRMIFPSRAMARTVESCYGGLLDGGIGPRSVVVPWGVWDPRADDNDAARLSRELREHYQLGPDTQVVLTLSRISPEKGLHLLLKAARLLEEQNDLGKKDVVLFVCGEPAFMQGQAYWKKVQAEAARLRKIRVFFPGYLGFAHKRAFLSLAHLFVSPSIHESYGLSIVEAMQAGKAVLASDHYGVQDLLTEDFGRVVRYQGLSKAPAQLKAALAELLADPARLKRMGQAAKEAAAAMPFERAARRVLDAALEAIG